MMDLLNCRLLSFAVELDSLDVYKWKYFFIFYFLPFRCVALTQHQKQIGPLDELYICILAEGGW